MDGMTFSDDSAFRRHLTLRRVFVWAFLLSLFALAVRQSTNLDSDFWWHLKSGQYMIQTRAIPHLDPFSFTRAGSPWIAHEWLSEVIMYGTFRLAGWAGLLILFAAVTTAALGISYQRSEGKPFSAGLAVFLAAMASAPLFGLRPQMFTFLLASIFLAVLDRYVQEGGRRILWLLPPSMLLWVNLHAGFALGPPLILLFVTIAALERNWQRIQPLITILVICVAVIPINPSGFRMFSYPFETLSSPAMQSLIQEWLSPDFHQFRFLPLAALMLATFAIVALSPDRVRLGELFALVVLSFAALRSGRHIPIFAIFAAPVFSKYLSRWISSQKGEFLRIRSRSPTGPVIILNVALILLPALVAARRIVDFTSHETLYEARRFPSTAVAVIGKEQLPGQIFNDYNWGGYLIWKLYPERKVFIDGRADVYGDSFVFDYLRTYQGDRLWRANLDGFGIRTVLIEPDSALATLLRQEKGWRTAFEDQQAVIFTRE
jgi:hypothetical protein